MIPSFSVDHRAIVPGIFVSRVDQVGSGTVTTYDIRLTRPNREPAVDVGAMHSLEHIIATFLRNDPDWKDDIIYWGPMGCLTGFYLLLKGERSSREIYDLILRAFRPRASPAPPRKTAVTASCITSAWRNGTRPGLPITSRRTRKTPPSSSTRRPSALSRTTDGSSTIRERIESRLLRKTALLQNKDERVNVYLSS